MSKYHQRAFWVHKNEQAIYGGNEYARDVLHPSHTVDNNKKLEEQNLKLVKKYVMIKGRLQPALNYIKEQPTIHRYEVEGDI